MGKSFFDPSALTVTPRGGGIPEEWVYSLYTLLGGVAFLINAYCYYKKIMKGSG